MGIFVKKVQYCWKICEALVVYGLKYSHKKQKGSLDGSLDWVLFAVELEFSKILVPRLP